MVTRFWVFVFGMAFLLIGCAVVEVASENEQDSINQNNLPVLGEAPELSGDTWLNTDQPLRLGELRGNVVLLEMWTFG